MAERGLENPTGCGKGPRNPWSFCYCSVVIAASNNVNMISTAAWHKLTMLAGSVLSRYLVPARLQCCGLPHGVPFAIQLHRFASLIAIHHELHSSGRNALTERCHNRGERHWLFHLRWIFVITHSYCGGTGKDLVRKSICFRETEITSDLDIEDAVCVRNLVLDDAARLLCHFHVYWTRRLGPRNGARRLFRRPGVHSERLC